MNELINKYIYLLKVRVLICNIIPDGQSCSGLESLASQQQQQQQQHQQQSQQPVRLSHWGEPGPFLQGPIPPFTMAQQLAHMGQPGMRLPHQLLRPNWGIGATAEDENRVSRSVG